MKKLIPFSISLLFIFGSFDIAAAQNKKHIRDALYVQLGGAGVSLLSFNYSRQLIGPLHGRAGLGFSLDLSDSNILVGPDHLISMPLQLSYLIGGETNFLELSGGVTPTYVTETTETSDEGFFIVPSVMVGYRRQPLGDGFLFRINAGIVYFQLDIQPLFGLSFGFVLN